MKSLNPLQEVGVVKLRPFTVALMGDSLNPLQEVGVVKLTKCSEEQRLVRS